MERPITLIDALSATARGAPHLAEVAALRVVDGEVEASFERAVCPPVPLDAEVIERSGLTDDDLRNGVFAAEALNELTAFCGDTWLFVHDVEGVGTLLAFEAARQGSALPEAPLVSVLDLARRHFEDLPASLEEQARALEFEPDDLGDPGRALGRCVHVWKLLEACLERAGQPNEAALSAPLDARSAPTSLRQLAPSDPRMSPRLRPLERARDAGEDVTLVYGNGDEHPVRLCVRPGFLFERRGKGYLEAECLRSGALKTYLLERVRKVL